MHFPPKAASVSNRTTYTEPMSFQHAMSYPDWEEWDKATQEELNSFVTNKVIEPCDETDIPPGKNVVDTKLIYKLKKLLDGTIDKYKARLVCRGFTQIHGEDFDETFAPVSQLVTIRTILVLCLQLGFKPKHLDVKTAFLNATLEHEIYIKLPKGVTILGKQFGKALKSIYGLKQAAHDWHQLQEKFILNFDLRMKRSAVDPCLYYIIDGSLIVLISTHVDDYMVATNSDEFYKQFLTAFSKEFTITELGEVDYILQMGVTWSADSKKMTLSQERHITELAEEHGLLNCKPVSTPMEKDIHLEPAAVCDTKYPFRRVIGMLLWIARATRPDIYFAVIYLARFSSCSDVTHFQAAKRIVRYLVSTIDVNLTYVKDEDFDLTKGIDLTVFSDSDWASDKNDRKSNSGNVTFVAGCPVSWYCKKQSTVALSSTEAEYMALSDGTREGIYITQLIDEIFPIKKPISIFIDNKGCGYIAEQNVNNKLTKHIDVRYHFVRHYISSKFLELFYVPTAENIADIFTKSLGTEIFARLSVLLMGCSVGKNKIFGR